MCARLLAPAARAASRAGWRAGRERALRARLLRGYERTLGWALAHPRAGPDARCSRRSASTSICYVVVPKGFFPQQDTGRLIGGIQADQSISFQSMKEKLAAADRRSCGSDPAVDSVVGFTGGGADQLGLHVRLAEALRRAQDVTADQVIDAAAAAAGRGAGRQLFLQAVQDIRVGGRQSNAQYQYTLQGDSTAELYEWAPKLAAALADVPRARRRQLRPAAERAGDARSSIDRATAARLGITPARSTTRSTTPSASGRSRRSTTR